MTYPTEALDEYQRMSLETLRRWKPELSTQESVILRNCLAISKHIATIIHHQELMVYGAIDRQSVFTVIGLIGESGEFIDVLKKVILHKQEISSDVIADEAGDVMWYLVTTAHVLGYSMSQLDNPTNDTMLALRLIKTSVEIICKMYDIPLSKVLEGNIMKLHKKRYPNGFQFGGGNDRLK